MRFFYLALAVVLTATGCNVLQPSVKNTSSASKRIQYSRGSCFGRCPVYDLEVYENGLLVFNGKRFVDKGGPWQRSVDRSRVTALLAAFEAADFENYPSNFRSEIADASKIDIVYIGQDGQAYGTSFTDYAPDELLALDRQLQELATLDGYRPVLDSLSRNPFRGVTDKQREEIIVELQPGTEVNSWLIGYGKQNVELKERLSPNGNYYLITADPNLMAAEELLEYLRQDEAVMSAQRNGRVGPR